MSDEEVRRAGVLKRVKAGELTQVEAAEMLALSYRQVKRLYGRFVEGGTRGLVHRSAGKPSNRARPAGERKQVLALVRALRRRSGRAFRSDAGGRTLA